MYEPTWSQPLTDWQPSPSFRNTAIPPSAGPLSGTLVQLPCINQDWLPLLLGAVDQLRNPSTWQDTLSDAALDTVLGQVDYLRSAISEALNVPCCSYQLRFDSDCVLRYSTDGGATWNPVTGWSTNFTNCVSNVTIPGVPSNPGGNTPDQQACNIAGYLATQIIQLAVSQAVSAFNASQTQLEFAAGLMDLISYAFPITFYAFNAFYQFYSAYNSSTISAFTTASTDTTLWGQVTCAVYEAIKSTGYVTATNLPNVISNVCSISYSSSAVVSAICGFITNIGLQNLQKIQSIAIVDTVDCLGCLGTWCYEFSDAKGNFSSVPPWQNPPAEQPPLQNRGTYVGGVGWRSDFVIGAVQICDLYYSTFTLTQIRNVTIDWTRTDAAGSGDSFIEVGNGGGPTAYRFALPTSAGSFSRTFNVGHPCDYIYFAVDSVTSVATDYNYVTRVRLEGDGTNPFGTSNCP